MPRTSDGVLFPTWRELWQSSADARILLEQADSVLRQRMAGNRRVPVYKETSTEQFTAALDCAKRWSIGDEPLDVGRRPALAHRIATLLQSSLSASAWPRWLLLERAFLDASATGDLLFAALALRTMCEELKQLHALDVDPEQIATWASSNDGASRSHLRLFFSCAWTSLAVLPEKMVLEGEGWPIHQPVRDKLDRLECSRKSLNSYVHPNYGSHIAALYPEGATVCKVLIDAFLAVYESFFSLSWTENAPARDAGPVGVNSVRSWSRSVRDFQSFVLPEARRTAELPELSEFLKVPATIKWLNTDQANAARILSNASLEEWAQELPRYDKAPGPGQGISFRLWDGASETDVIMFCCARRAEQRLSKDFPQGAPDTEDQVSWLQFIARSVELVVLLDAIKAATLKTQIVRQITQGNSLAALLCARSLIEHLALAGWLHQIIDGSLNALTNKLSASAPLPDNAIEIINALAKYLATNSTKCENNPKPWTLIKKGKNVSFQLKIKEIIDIGLDKNDKLHKFYSISCAAMHGRMHRGWDLVRQSDLLRQNARAVGLVVLERICLMELNSSIGLMILAMQMEHAARFGGTHAAVSNAMARQAFGGIDDLLQEGIDYSGDGSAERPFKLGSHLFYYTGCYRLLRQLGVDTTCSMKYLYQDATGDYCDRWEVGD